MLIFSRQDQPKNGKTWLTTKIHMLLIWIKYKNGSEVSVHGMLNISYFRQTVWHRQAWTCPKHLFGSVSTNRVKIMNIGAEFLFYANCKITITEDHKPQDKTSLALSLAFISHGIWLKHSLAACNALHISMAMTWQKIIIKVDMVCNILWAVKIGFIHHITIDRQTDRCISSMYVCSQSYLHIYNQSLNEAIPKSSNHASTLIH